MVARLERRARHASPRQHSFVRPRASSGNVPSKSDKELVEQAEAHLSTLLVDPYYYEAYQRLLRKRVPFVASRRGNLPAVKGELAGLLQRPAPSIKGRLGRPPIAVPGLDYFLKLRPQFPPKLSVVEAWRRILRGMFPGARAQAIEAKAQLMAQATRNHIKKQRR